MPIDRPKTSSQLIEARKSNYTSTFNTAIGKEVLKDLAKFCRASESCFSPDPHTMAFLEGRREVYLRILDHLELTQEELFTKYGGIS